jgi:uncharacterized protein YqjF (DUF2071 family)
VALEWMPVDHQILPPVFLTAEWRHLVMLNYDIDPNILTPLVPFGTELDSWSGRTLVSVVGFLFLQTRVRGVRIPFHRNFEEINLRFYVRRKVDTGWRRAVVFIREIVPRAAIAFIARALYNEPYLALPTSHLIESKPGHPEEITSAAYFWKINGRANFIKLATRGNAQHRVAGSEQEFITEHYWGYTAQRDGSTLEYRVEHPPWRVWESETAELNCDVAALYGPRFLSVLNCRPCSAFLAEGSAVKVYQGVRLK